MTECTRPLDPLLAATPEELAGRGDTETARHVGICPRCGAAARRILAANGALDAVLGSAATHALAERALRTPPTPPRRRLRTVTWPWWATAGAAVAAVLVAVTVPRPDDFTEWVPPPDAAVQRPLVTAPDRNVLVMPTGNPDITIIWLYEETKG